MDKKLIEQIALEVAKEVTPEFVWEEGCNHECGVCKHELYEFAAKFLARIDAERGKEAVAWLHESRRESDVVTTAVKHVWGGVAVGSLAAYSIPLFLSPALSRSEVKRLYAQMFRGKGVPDGVALVPIEPTEEMLQEGRRADSAWCEVETDINIFESGLVAIYKAMIAAAQGERNAD